MTGNGLSLLYLGVFLAAGAGLARRLVPHADAQERGVLASGFATALLAGLPALAALVFDFTLPAALTALAGAAALAVWGWLPAGGTAMGRNVWKGFWLCTLAAAALTFWLLFTHTLSLKDGAYWCGQSTYGDLPMHLALIEALAQQGDFPPGFSLLAGQTVAGYHFLCESVSSVFLLLGAGLKFACLLPEFAALPAVFGGAWLLARRLLKSAGAASLAFWLFFMGSGFGFVYFLGGEKGNFTRIFTAFYETPTNYVEENIRWVNPIVDMLVPQRATLFGWALLFPALALLAAFALEGRREVWPAIALLAAPLPLTQTHAALALVLVCAVLFARQLLTDRSRAALAPWLALAAVCAAVWLPQLLGEILPGVQSGERFLRLSFNWANEGDNYFWFYIKNIGVVYLLLIPAFLAADRPLRWFYGGGLAILLLSELVVFQPNDYDNNKLLFVWHLLGCILVAGLLRKFAGSLRCGGRHCRPARLLAVAALVFLASFGSLLTVGRELVSEYQQFSADAIAAGQWAKEETDPHALFLTGTQHINAVASLGGRTVLCGSPSYLYYHGLKYGEQQAAAKAMYETPDAALLAQWGVDYVVFSGFERSEFAADEGWYQRNCSEVFRQGEYVIYKVG